MPYQSSVKFSVCFVINWFQPFVGCFRTWNAKCQMTEPAVLLGAVPVLDVGGNLNDIARLQTLRRLALFLIPAFAINADQDLTTATGCVMNVPVVAAAWFKSNVADC